MKLCVKRNRTPEEINQAINSIICSLIVDNNSSGIILITTDSSGILKSTQLVDKEVLKIEKAGMPLYYENTHFTKLLASDTITMIPPNTLSNTTQYIITIK